MVVAGTLLVILVAIFGWLVFGRYVLNSTPTWVEQWSLIIVAYVTFLGAAVGIRRGTHLSIDFVREAMPGAVRIPLHLLSDLMMIVFGAFMGWQGWLLVATNVNRIVPLINISESWRAAPVMVCGILIVLFASFDMLARIQRGISRGV
ncbi:TRAP transporter small permease [Stappia sp. F7233]|uniref:TRAP transporter small permease protein n=2 Tax=Stappia albiluteola TaxID=2758565 RepID=A0A839ALX4_9HYPH|nr:TRAP transporter small permease [Stappia albiluteola]